MKLLIAAENGIYQINYFNNNAQIKTLVFDEKFRHFGLLEDNNLIYYTIMDFKYKKNGDINLKGKILAVDKESFEIVYANETFSPDIHHLVIWNNKIVTLSVTGDLMLYSKDLSTIEYFEDMNSVVPKQLAHGPLLSDRGQIGLRNLYHFNYICLDDNTLYAMAHNLIKPSFVLKYDMVTKNVSAIELDGPMHHDCLISDGKIYINDSIRSTLKLMSLDGKLISRTLLAGFVRGICITENFIIVGASPDRESDVLSTAQLFLLDKQTLNIIDIIKIPNADQIYDILEI